MAEEYTKEQLEALKNLKQIAKDSPEAMQEILKIMALSEEDEKAILDEMGEEMQIEIESRQKEREEQEAKRDSKVEKMKAQVNAAFNAEILRLENQISKLGFEQEEEIAQLEIEIVEIKAMKDRRK
ncbi:MAG: hypothetical protein Q9M32_05740 [Sulfurimonas sp.]|nr:hypothetical protein [Sulfurimonas sp.]